MAEKKKKTKPKPKTEMELLYDKFRASPPIIKKTISFQDWCIVEKLDEILTILKGEKK